MKILAKDRQTAFKLSHIVISCIMMYLMFVKCLHFYRLLGLTGYEIPLAAATALIFVLIYCAVAVFSPKAAFITVVSLYCVMSVFMSIDLVYYRYMGKLPSFGLLSMMWQIGGVTDTVGTLIGHEQLMPLMDLPIWLILAFNKQLFKKLQTREVSWKAPLKSAGVVFLALALLIAQASAFGEFKARYLSNELISYHMTDLIDCLKPRSSRHNVNKDDYTAESQSANANFGIAKGRNVFVIQLEAFQDFVIGAERNGEVLTPFLNSLIENDSFYFENYYYQIGAGNTSDAEFTANNSLYASEDTSSYEKYTDNKFNSLSLILRKNGYTESTAFHEYYENFWIRNKAYPYQGFTDFISIEDVEYHPREGCVMANEESTANTDRRLYEDVLDKITTYKTPFHSFIITLSSHHPFAVAPEDRYVDSDNPAPNLLDLYLQSTAYVDRTLEEFMDALKKEGLYENSIFVLYGDHYAISQVDEEYATEIESFTGEPYSIVERFKVPLIIHVPGMDKAEKIDTVGAHIDVLPTLLCLLGIDNTDSVMFGHNLLDPEYEGIVYELMHIRPGSFITKDVFYMHSESGINSKAYDMYGNLIEVKDEYLEMADKAIKVIEDCHALLDADDIMID